MKRNAHSLIEMLVVLIIVAVLIAIVVPAVQRARESARMAQCIHNQGQLAQAIHLHITDEPYGRFPGYRTFAADGTTVIGWAPQVFEYLGRNDAPADPTQATYVEVLVCPSNQGPKASPRLNYVVNGGQPDIDSPADGIFFDHAKNERVYITKDDFSDGLTNTIMIAENLDATEWNVTDEANQCILWPLTAGNEINNGEGARPSSHHPGGFVAAFADGSVKFMQEAELNDDPGVHSNGSIYVAYLTPGGDDSPDVEIVDSVHCDQLGEPVVVDGLDWLARHQFDIGYWSLKHSHHPDCNGSCTDDATGTSVDPRPAATGLALLPLLGAGHTLTSGPYQDNVCRGVEYLLAIQGDDGSLIVQDTFAWGYMYSHLIASLALSEALAIGEEIESAGCGEEPCSVDLAALREAVQKAVDFAVANQSTTGSWAYHGNSPGPLRNNPDISHFSWGALLYQNAVNLGLNVPESSLDSLSPFLDLVEYNPVTDSASGVTLGDYGYYGPAPFNSSYAETESAIGLLNRVLLGAPADHLKIQNFTANRVPDDAEMYLNFHTTHLMLRVGGTDADNWMQAIAEKYDAFQETSGHAAGSWFLHNSDYNWVGGRHYCTCMALLCYEQTITRLKLGGE